MIQEPLWTGLGLVGALDARVSGGGLPRKASGVSIDTRTLEPGDLFFAIKGDARDGHDFVLAAFEKGAAAAVVDEAARARLRGRRSAFRRQGRAGRAGAPRRICARAHARPISRRSPARLEKHRPRTWRALVFSRFGATHASAASYNNQWGVPLSLARMPAATRFGVFEIGMNHAGEIAALVAQVKPHVAVVTRSRRCTSNISTRWRPSPTPRPRFSAACSRDGVAIVNRDDETFERLAEAARVSGAGHVFSFGSGAGAEARLISYETHGAVGVASAEIFGRRIDYRIDAPGAHMAHNALAVLLVASVFDIDLEQAAAALEEFTPSKGARRRETLRTRGRDDHLDRRKLQRQSRHPCARLWRCSAATTPGLRRTARRRARRHAGARAALGRTARRTGERSRARRVDLLFTAGPRHGARLLRRARQRCAARIVSPPPNLKALLLSALRRRRRGDGQGIERFVARARLSRRCANSSNAAANAG